MRPFKGASLKRVPPELRHVLQPIIDFLQQLGPTGSGSTVVNEGDIISVTSGSTPAPSSSTVFADTAFRVTDDTITSKQLAVECSGIAASTTRTWAIADKNGTPAIASNTPGTDEVLLTSGATQEQWGKVTAAHIASRMRSVIIPAERFIDVGSGGPIATLTGTYPTAYVAVPMIDGPATQDVATFMIPQDFESFDSWKILYTNGGVSPNGTYWRLYARSVSAGGALDGANTISLATSSVPSATTHALNVFQIGIDGTGLTAGQTVRLGIERDPTDGADTNASTMYFVAVQFDYNSDM